MKRIDPGESRVARGVLNPKFGAQMFLVGMPPQRPQVSGLATVDQNTVLIVTADQDALAAHIRCLEGGEPGYNTLSSSTAQEALDICQEMIPDCIVVDDRLPDLGVLEFLTHLSSAPRKARFAVVALLPSGKVELEDMVLRHGAQDCLFEDELTPRSLRRAVRNTIRRFVLAADLDRLILALQKSEEWDCNAYKSTEASSNAEAGEKPKLALDAAVANLACSCTARFRNRTGGTTRLIDCRIRAGEGNVTSTRRKDACVN